MKRFSSSDSLAAAILCISSAKEDEKKTEKSKQMGYSREFQAMLDSLDEEDYIEEAATDHNIIGKKRRLTLEQVKALEKEFEVENKLEPERKQRLAEDLGLQPRQVAIWFQNRRARWKSKQLERDYGTLKSSYESLKLDYSSLENKNEALTLKLKELKGKFNDSNRSIKDEEYYPVVSEQSQSQYFSDKDHNDGSSANGFMDSWIHVSESRTSFGNQESCQPHPIKVEEEQGVFSSEGSCNFFSVDQPPTLHWYFPDQQ